MDVKRIDNVFVFRRKEHQHYAKSKGAGLIMRIEKKFIKWVLFLAIGCFFIGTTTSCSYIKTSGTVTREIGETLDEIGDREEHRGTCLGSLFNWSGGIYSKVGETVEDIAVRGEKGESKTALFVEGNKRIFKDGMDETREFMGSNSSDKTAIKLSSSQVTKVQKKLKSSGYDPGPIDGDYGKRTRKALRAYQKDKGLAVTGAIDKPTLKAMGMW